MSVVCSVCDSDTYTVVRFRYRQRDSDTDILTHNILSMFLATDNVTELLLLIVSLRY